MIFAKFNQPAKHIEDESAAKEAYKVFREQDAIKGFEGIKLIFTRSAEGGIASMGSLINSGSLVLKALTDSECVDLNASFDRFVNLAVCDGFVESTKIVSPYCYQLVANPHHPQPGFDKV